MKSLKDILYGVGLTAVSGSTAIMVNAVLLILERLQRNDVFVAIKGTITDGHKFIENAIVTGANTIVCENLPRFDGRWYYLC